MGDAPPPPSCEPESERVLWPALLLAIFSLLPFAAAARWGVALNDDALISLTYSKNLLLGNGFVYNHPPATFGTTTPLWTLLAALAALPFGWEMLPAVAVWLSAACWAAIGWLVFLARRHFRLDPWTAALAGIVFSTAQYPYLGAESNLFCLLLFALFAAAFARRPFLTGLAGALLFLARGEGALALAIAAAWLLLHTGGLPARARATARIAAGAALVLLPWCVYAYARFGHVLPQTLRAKMLQGRLPGATLFHETFFEIMTRQWGADAAPFGLDMRLIAWTAVALGILWLALRARPLLLLPLWALLYALAYILLRVPGYAWWYFIPVYWMWLFCAAIGLAALVHMAGSIPSRPVSRLLRALALVCVVLFVLVRAHSVFVLAAEREDYRARTYHAACDWLNQHADPHDALASAEVGYFGFFTSLRILDSSGLITRGSLEYIEAGIGPLLEEHAPRFFLIASWTDQPILRRAIKTARDAGYHHVVTLGDPPRQSLIYERITLPPNPPPAPAAPPAVP